jgi:ankyrin repeat protein
MASIVDEQLVALCFGEGSVDQARDLLSRGADPNAYFTNEYGNMPVLYGAAGVRHDPALTQLLLDAGAEPTDGESLYHSTEAESPECLRILLAHGGKPEPIVLAHALDDERMEHVRLLLDAGVDARTSLVHAVRRGRGPECLKLLYEHGAELEHRGGEEWRGRDIRRRTAYQHAVLRSQHDNAALLASLGADTRVDDDDLAVADLRHPGTPLDYDQQEVVCLRAGHGDLERVIEVFGPNFRGVVFGSPEATLLEHAAWAGREDLVRALLAAGAEVTPRYVELAAQRRR